MKLQDFDFRIWNKKENKYINKECIIGFRFDNNKNIEECVNFTRFGYINGIREIQHQTMKTLFPESDGLEIELFTGVYDRMGYKIYEGDIIGFSDTGRDIADYLNGIVFYNPDKATFIVTINDKDISYSILMSEIVQANELGGVELVGNIHYYDPEGGLIRTKV